MTQINYGQKQPYKAAKEAHTPATQAQTNFGGRTTKKAGGKAYYETRRQMNYENKESIPVKFERGQGQKPGTGCQDGY